MFKKRLDKFINHDGTELAVGALIIASIVLMILEVSTPRGTPANELYANLGVAITGLFVVELTIRWYVASSTRRFLLHYWLDILAVMPVIRPLRILRVLRLLRLPRLCLMLARRMRRAASAFSEGLAENLLIVIILIVVFLFGAIGIRIVEPNNADVTTFGDAVWWSLYTLMAGEPTLGEPQTPLGRIVTMAVMLGGFTIFAMFTGVVSAVMVDRLRGDMAAKDMELEELEGHFVICGWNRAAVAIIRELQANAGTRQRAIVIIAELDEEPRLGDQINHGLIFFVREDFTSTEVLRRVRVQRAAGVILLADKSRPRVDEDRDARTILAALTIEKLPEDTARPGADIYTCVELLRRTRHKMWVLKGAGVEDVVEGDEYLGNLVAHATRAFGLVQVLDELLTSTRGSEFEQLTVPEHQAGWTFERALRSYKEHDDQLIVALLPTSMPGPDPDHTEYDPEDRACAPIVNPAADTLLAAGQELIVMTHPHARSTAELPTKVDCGTTAAVSWPTEPAETLDEVRDHYIIFGWNRAAPKIINQLRAGSQTRHAPVVVAADTLPGDWESVVGDRAPFFVAGDYTSPDVLRKAGVERARTAVLLADKTIPRADQDRDARTILAALTIEKMKRGIHTCVELLNRDAEKVKVLRKAGVEDIVVGDEYLGNLIAHSVRTPGLAQALDELLTSSFYNEFYKVRLPEELADTPFVDVMLAYKREHNALAIAVETATRPDFGEASPRSEPPLRHGRTRRYYLTNPPPQLLLRRADSLFVIASGLDQEEVVG